MGKTLEAFIFDLDGVITDTAEYHFLAWKALANELGIDFDRDFNEKLKGVSRMDSLDLILEHGGKREHFTPEDREKFAAQKNNHYKELIKNITPNDVLPGIKTFIEEIKKNGFKIGLASASKNAFTVVDSLGLTESFDTIVDSAKISKGKPDPEIFLTAAKQLGVKPEQCIGIEDAASGVDAINSAGMFSVGVGDHEILSHANLVFSSTSELQLKTILKAFNENASISEPLEA
ncbi:beta-phosphoglucomutase [Peribacillus tepidiphilus]|uniref:beta-phosphoglucomutase n=1 Tax=Peribacillus tepidiphilus TaxID=2652445 RepID=UPI0035B52647